MAILPTFVIIHNTNPAKESTPHIKSNLVTFHSAFLFTNEAIKTVIGMKPVPNVIKASRSTPYWICAKKAINGAMDHNKNEILLGLTLPFTVSIK